MLPQLLVLLLILDWVSVSVWSQVKVPIPVLWMVPGPDLVLVSSPDSALDSALVPGLVSGPNPALVPGLAPGPDPALVLALTLAMEDLKEHHGLLKNHKLQLHKLEGQCDASMALKSLFKEKGAGLELLLLLGEACPSVTSLLLPALPALNMVQVSFLAPPPLLSHRRGLGHMVSTVPSDWALNQALVKLLQTLNWTRVGLISEKTQRISQALRDLQLQLDQAQVQVLSSVRFSQDACSALKQLKDREVRIFIALVEEHSASELFCCVYRQSLFGPRLQWLFLGAVGRWSLGWTQSLCSTQSLVTAAEGSIQVQVQGLRFNQDPGVSGKSAEQYEHLYLQRLSSFGLKAAPLHGFVYDAVWLAALALNRLLDQTKNQNQIGTLNPNKTLNAPRDLQLSAHKLLQAVKATRFNGVTGPVQFRGGERMATLELTQFQGSSSVVVGEFNTSDQNLTLNLHLLQFKGSGPPRDRTMVRTQLRHVTLALYVVMAAASSIIILFSLSILFLCLLNRRLRLVLWRSVSQEELLCLGVILCCVSVLVSGLDQVPVSDQTRTVLCSVHVWTLCVGHSVIFSVFFTEAWTQYSLRHHLPKSHLQTPWRLLLWLLLLEALVLSSWTLTDPLSWVETLLLLQVDQSEEDAMVQTVSCLCGCSSSELWVMTVCGYKCPLLLFVSWLEISVPQTEEEEQQRKTRNRELRNRSLQLGLEIDRLRRELFYPGSTQESTHKYPESTQETPPVNLNQQ
ncbi:gamma-aminobutyric acid type B receptor subunit 2-like [Periophthalmus magnuspinnatus]|uniref:gamma-aminobutyric acid type B receptor subunit 2-like n=1 Tax=Periophthalmus magnuspinnatus TaxID=409849 RepID=UPI002436FA69|nr:gamma-aminobutyric acid type B receptor subunit 2-like [Periophthalmus magnuspinnatus]